ncbi:hypothetical protein WJX73_004220 [Symbiochloris irregularis]|uniref:Uncharacterized protein n=1 Tax=Symbiochloris irregularis TaxID=706552 RepID=A0AAW1P5I5_9CHLO
MASGPVQLVSGPAVEAPHEGQNGSFPLYMWRRCQIIFQGQLVNLAAVTVPEPFDPIQAGLQFWQEGLTTLMPISGGFEKGLLQVQTPEADADPAAGSSYQFFIGLPSSTTNVMSHICVNLTCRGFGQKSPAVLIISKRPTLDAIKRQMPSYDDNLKNKPRLSKRKLQMATPGLMIASAREQLTGSSNHAAEAWSSKLLRDLAQEAAPGAQGAIDMDEQEHPQSAPLQRGKRRHMAGAHGDAPAGRAKRSRLTANNHGTQLAGTAAHGHGTTNGTQLAGTAAHGHGITNGTQFAGTAAHGHGTTNGTQLAGTAAHGHGTTNGTQFAGTAAHGHGTTNGTQLAGTAAHGHGTTNGTQFAGTAAHGHGTTNGTQLAGTAAHGHGTTNGTQFAGTAAHGHGTTNGNEADGAAANGGAGHNGQGHLSRHLQHALASLQAVAERAGPRSQAELSRLRAGVSRLTTGLVPSCSDIAARAALPQAPAPQTPVEYFSRQEVEALLGDVYRGFMAHVLELVHAGDVARSALHAAAVLNLRLVALVDSLWELVQQQHHQQRQHQQHQHQHPQAARGQAGTAWGWQACAMAGTCFACGVGVGILLTWPYSTGLTHANLSRNG